MSWFYLALLAPLLQAAIVLLDDNLLRFVYKTPYLATTFAGFFGALPILAIIFKTPNIPFNLAVLAIVSGVLTAGYYFFYFKGLESDTPAIVIALFGLAPATIPFLAHFLVHENLTAWQVAGFVIVLLASLGLSVVDIKKLKFSRALVSVLIAVVFIDVLSLTSKYVYQRADFYSAYMYFCIGMGLGGLCFLMLQFAENRQGLHDIRKILKKVLPFFMAAELLNLTGEFVLNLAISRGPVSLVKAIESLQPMFVLLIALVLFPFAPRFFRDANSGQLIKKFVFMAIAVAGLALIGLSE